MPRVACGTKQGLREGPMDGLLCAPESAQISMCEWRLHLQRPAGPLTWVHMDHMQVPFLSEAPASCAGLALKTW